MILHTFIHVTHSPLVTQALSLEWVACLGWLWGVVSSDLLVPPPVLTSRSSSVTVVQTGYPDTCSGGPDPGPSGCGTPGVADPSASRTYLRGMFIPLVGPLSSVHTLQPSATPCELLGDLFKTTPDGLCPSRTTAGLKHSPQWRCTPILSQLAVCSQYPNSRDLLHLMHHPPSPIQVFSSLSDGNSLPARLQENTHSLAPQLVAWWQLMPPSSSLMSPWLLLRKSMLNCQAS